MLKPELFTDIANKLKELHDKIVSGEFKHLLNDINALVDKLAPILAELDASIEKLMHEGVENTLRKLADKGLDQLRQDALEKLAKETGLPVDRLRDFMNLPNGFDPDKAVDKLKEAAKGEGLKGAQERAKEARCSF